MNKGRSILPLLTVIAGVFASESAIAQCTLQAFPSDTVTITCGEARYIQLSAFGISGDFAINNDFNNGTFGPGWSGTPAATFSNPCGNSSDGTTYLWMGDATPQPRTLTTQPFDLSTGGTICFEMRYSVQGANAPCEGPDEPQEGVHLQYSINNGATWVEIDYWDPLGGNDPTLTSWQQYCRNIPVAAQTASTRVRWFQDATSGAEYDHWGLDNVFIALNDPNYYYLWSHNGSNAQEPPIVSVTSDSLFTVIYTNGVDDTCSAQVVVQTVPPVFDISTIADTSFCASSGCVQLNGAADVLVRPASQPMFFNNEFQPIAPLNQPTVIPVAVGGMPVETATASTVLSVCLNVNNPALPFPVDFATLTITLECPSGTSITLVSAGSVSGTSLANMCFADNGTPLSSGTPPFTGTFQPASGSLADFAGCTTNGVWRMTITNSAFFAFGFFNNWSINFDVPEISYTGLYQWQPTIGLDDPLSLNPQACPPTSTTYELMVTDSFNCATASHFVTIGIIEPGQLSVQATVADANCGSTDGAISIVVVGASGNETVTWADGTVGSELSGLAPGQYALTVEDGCALDTIIGVGVLGGPQIDSLDITKPQSEMSDGQIIVIASGGNAPLEYSINGGLAQMENAFASLAVGNYFILVEDAFGCQDTVSMVLDDIVEIVIPNVFNPNSQNLDNKTFFIKGITDPEVAVYNRWGFKIFESPAYKNDWNGENYPDGTYFFTIRENPDGQTHMGFVQLMR